MLRFSANLGFLWPDRPLLERVEAAARAGFPAIEMHWPYEIPAEEMRRTCQESGVKALSINTVRGPRPDDMGLAAQPGRQSEFVEIFDQAVDYARAIGAGNVHVMAGTVDEKTGDEARRVLIDNLAAASRKAPDLTLLLEALNPRDAPGYFYSTVGEAADIIDAVGAPNLRLMFDAYHVGSGEGDILVKLSRHLPIIGHVQIAAVPSRAEPNEGEIAYPAVFAKLEDIGYSGWIGCEYKPRAGTDEGLEWMKQFGVGLTPRNI